MILDMMKTMVSDEENDMIDVRALQLDQTVISQQKGEDTISRNRSFPADDFPPVNQRTTGQMHTHIVSSSRGKQASKKTYDIVHSSNVLQTTGKKALQSRFWKGLAYSCLSITLY
ncbi:hypothetical protein Tco_1002786 [Tanacetum coccineum]|uniref:Uncharacterized protein n=1 Tax=Tanacetum coccineum TaxID=301880 RepID=A0ABQ5F8Q5_9ASTR